MDQPQRDAIYNYVQGVLDSAARTSNSSVLVEDVLHAVRASVDAACADFAQTWNSQNSLVNVAGHLAPEILIKCLRFADFKSLIHATHVCRRWRAVALAERPLWASFQIDRRSSRGTYDDKEAISQLTVMLDRSRPVPFTLQLPWAANWPEDLALALLDRDFCRLRSYTGPLHIYMAANPHSAPTPSLTHLEIYDEDVHPVPFVFPPQWGSRGAPNLRHLNAGLISVPPTCGVLRALRYLRFHAAGPVEGYHRVFHCCPHLVTLDLLGITATTALPAGSPPASLDRLALHASGRATVDVESLKLASWLARPIRRLIVSPAKDLSAALDIFLSSFQGPLVIVMSRHQVAISLADGGRSGPGTRPYHIVRISWLQQDPMLALRGACADRLASISVPGDRLDDFFAARLTMPQLTSIKFTFDCSAERLKLSDPPSPEFHLGAPRLRDMTVALPFDPSSLCISWMCTPFLAVLRSSLRVLIAYDALLLDTITVRGAASVTSSLGCNLLAPFAKAYVEITDVEVARQLEARNLWARGVPDHLLPPGMEVP